jgi:hypothetical protein
MGINGKKRKIPTFQTRLTQDKCGGLGLRKSLPKIWALMVKTNSDFENHG